MEEEYYMEEVADMAIGVARECINIEEQIVNDGHDTTTNIYACEHILEHLLERVSEENVDFLDLSRRITDRLEELRLLIEDGKKIGLKIEEETEEIKTKLGEKVEHRNFQAIREDIRLEEKELKKVHSMIVSLMMLIKQSELMPVSGKNLTSQREKDEFKKLEKYYLLQIYKILRAYERIFRHLWRKVRILAKKYIL